MFNQKKVKRLEAEIKLLKDDVRIYSESNIRLHGELIELKNKAYIRNAKGQIVKYEKDTQ